MKYIRFRSVLYSYDTIVTFDKNIPHLGLARELRKSDHDVLSAGFVRSTPEGLECYGESESLRVKMRDDDTELLRKQMDRPIQF